jgi:hypothetical protein
VISDKPFCVNLSAAGEAGLFDMRVAVQETGVF